MYTMLHWKFFFMSLAFLYLFKSSLHFFHLWILDIWLYYKSCRSSIKLWIAYSFCLFLRMVIQFQTFYKSRFLPYTFGVFKMIVYERGNISLIIRFHQFLINFYLNIFIKITWSPNEITFIYYLLVYNAINQFFFFKILCH
jgi:hypothetical protein